MPEGPVFEIQAPLPYFRPWVEVERGNGNLEQAGKPQQEAGSLGPGCQGDQRGWVCGGQDVS